MKSSTRIRFLAVLVVLYCVFLVARLFFLQVVKNQYYRDQADRQYLRPASGIFNRGSIYFSAKDGSLVAAATTKDGYVVSLNPRLVTNASSTYEALDKIFTSGGQVLAAEPFYAKAGKANDPYEELAGRVPANIAEQIAGLKKRELAVAKERWRFYPASTTAAHIIGIMGYKGDEYTGRYGLEKTYNEVLSRDEKQSFTNFFVEIYRGLVPVTDGTEPARGDLVLTIEPTVQNYLETTLAKTYRQYEAELAGGIIIDPKTGAILALSAFPNFNPGEKLTNLAVLPNPLLEGRYELGSIMKALTMAVGLDTKAVTAGTTYNDKGCLTLNTKLFCNYDGKARGVIPMQEVLSQSLNLGATFIEQQVGKEKFRAYFQNLGLGEKTGIDLPGEISGSLATLDNNQDVEFATASFGQGISVTPIEMVRALAALANGGYLVKPQVVKEIRYTTGLKRSIAPVIGRQVIASSTAREISRMLTVVVDTKLANGKAKLPHTSVAAKTGTAQYVDPVTREYYPDRYLHSFFGYFPSNNARFLVFLFIKHPLGVQYASETLTGPFLDITKFLLSYYEVPPDR